MNVKAMVKNVGKLSNGSEFETVGVVDGHRKAALQYF